MEGEESLKVYSPEIKIQDPCLKSAIPHFPSVYLVHGTADYSIPSVARLVYRIEIYYLKEFIWKKKDFIQLVHVKQYINFYL